MLQLGTIRAIDCGRVTRRAALSLGTLGVLGLSLAMCALAGLLASRKAAKADPADLF